MTLWHYLAISILIQLLFFSFAIVKKTDKVTDLAYGVGFVGILAIALFVEKSNQWFDFTVFGMVLLWALRLSTYLLIRIFAMGRDKRFDGIREYAQKFIKFFLFQGLAVWLISLSSLNTITSTTQASDIGILGVVGILTYGIGIVTESFADYQKYMFKKDTSNENKWIDSGLWKLARHPNYFGEMLVWWGIWIFSLPFTGNMWIVSLISPLTITCVLIFFSGIPPLEKRYNEKYKDNKRYQEYKRNTRLLMPLPKN